MKRWIKYILITIAVLSAFFAGVTSLRDRSVPMDDFIAIANGSQGTFLAAWYEGDHTIIGKINSSGKIDKYISYSTTDQNQIQSIRGLAAGTEDKAYMLLDLRDAFTGEVKKQQLVILDFGGMFPNWQKSFELTDETENYNYKWIQVSGETISLIGTDQYEETAVRRSYEYGSLIAGTLNVKNTRSYPLDAKEGIYTAIGNGTDLVYISDSGKIFCANEEEVKEVYPARTLDTLIYPTFLAYAESGYVFFGEHESGNIIKLDLSTGDEEVQIVGGSSVAGAGVYTAHDFVTMSMTSINTYTAAVYDKQEQQYQFIVNAAGDVSLIHGVSYSILVVLGKFAGALGIGFVAGCILFLLVWLFLNGIRYGKTTMGRLVFISVPLIVVAMTLFELIAYSYYKDAIEKNFEKQVADEGNMLTALFGQESFEEIQYPYDYTGEAYQYMNEQMKTRDLYTRVLYYEADDIYIGVDMEGPCYYPVDVWTNNSAKKLYEQAALTGNQVIGYIDDQVGSRLVCITPVGGSSGQTVYLMENGIFVSNIDSYMSGYIRNFTIICVAFSVMILVILSIFFYRILSPIHDIRRIMGSYVQGDKEARIEVNSEDELAGISRVFNKMADDTAVQIHNLEKMTDTYYRFVPASMLKLLQKENLADINLQTRVSGNYTVMQVFYRKEMHMEASEAEATTNRFFATVNHFATANGLVAIMDEADAAKIRLICSDSVDTALNTALAISARVDADNAKEDAKQQLHIFFVIHKTELSFGICGDEDRFIPAVFAGELDAVLDNSTFMKAIANRILLTRAAYESIENKAIYAGRYIGQVNMSEEQMGLYDIYDDRSADAVKRVERTREMFDKAVSLYEQGYYYEAKNIFTLVLRENTEDTVARYYIFQCERMQEKK